MLSTRLRVCMFACVWVSHCDTLLAAGAATVDILQQYVSAIRALRAVDPSRGIVEVVSAPIQGYLRGRTDAIRCIVASLTDNGGGEGEEAGLTLAEELARHPEEQVKGLRPHLTLEPC